MVYAFSLVPLEPIEERRFRVDSNDINLNLSSTAKVPVEI
jgi:hypothetical protein